MKSKERGVWEKQLSKNLHRLHKAYPAPNMSSVMDKSVIANIDRHGLVRWFIPLATSLALGAIIWINFPVNKSLEAPLEQMLMTDLQLLRWQSRTDYLLSPEPTLASVSTDWLSTLSLGDSMQEIPTPNSPFSSELKKSL